MKIKRCKRCQEKCRIVIRKIIYPRSKRYVVQCMECGAGVDSKFEKLAAYIWNRSN